MEKHRGSDYQIMQHSNAISISHPPTTPFINFSLLKNDKK